MMSNTDLKINEYKFSHEDFAKFIGLDLQEQFVANYNDAMKFTCKLTDDGLYALSNDGNNVWVHNKSTDSILNDIVAGKCTVNKIAFSPKNGDIYYYVNFEYKSYCFKNIEVESHSWSGSCFDFSHKYTGNCFRRREDAVESASKIIERITGLFCKL